ncbi:hypothetical protein Acor_45410 [Acrocarpospora corrugata]|uniref:ABC3 transporter permease C-terminal domain-containing protein n=1 Tax=Acrocarpospora corrugata TaxID=35763 RepID=A0A5M3W0A3_9ACTN|nr:FtsX-like permease family protein [Acrocarpospora corrugata]GES02475.1 hypothetical protein Acor_45410 [Acrocarpospora corrugata]
MGRVLLVCRLAVRDLRRRPAEAVLLLLAITAATATLTLGLVLQGASAQPYQTTRVATGGPDVVASVVASPGGDQLAALEALAGAPGVAGHSGPFPHTRLVVKARGVTTVAWTQGRGAASAPVDQPKVTEGGWVRDGGAVLEASFAQALGVRAGDRITLGDRSFQVAGVAVTAAMPPYPKICFSPCMFGEHQMAPPTAPPVSAPREDVNFGPPGPNGLLWVTDADARDLAARTRFLGYVMNLKLADPASAPAFIDAHLPTSLDTPFLASWQDVLYGHNKMIEWKQVAMLVSSWLLGMIALAGIVVLVAGRMADQLRRVGLLKAVGGTPGLVAAVLLAEYVAVALLASAAGLAIGRLAAPLLSEPATGLLGSAGAVPFTWSTVALVTAVALGIAGVATFLPAVRAARTSTVLALADAARPPRRTAWLIGISTRLPVPLLLGLRVAARRPRRTVLGMAGIAVAVAGIVAAMAANAHRFEEKAPGADPRTALSQVLLLMTVMLVAQAAVNAICITWSTALDARRSSALARALGATPAQVSAGLSTAQILPALAGALLGLATGIGLAELLDDDPVTVPPLWQLTAVVLGCVIVIAGLTAIPARLSARHPVGEILRTELT